MPLNIRVSEKRRMQCTKLVELSKAVIREAYDMFAPEEIGIVWTGGKNSSLALWCVRQVCAEQGLAMPKTLVIDRGDEFEEAKQFVSAYAPKWNVPLQIRCNRDVMEAADGTLGAAVRVCALNERNRKELEHIGFEDAEFPFYPESYTGKHLMKTVVFNEWMQENRISAVFQGRRWDEHPERFGEDYFQVVEGTPLAPGHTVVRPILHFTERDLWTCFAAFDIPFCPLYEMGYRTIGTRTASRKTLSIPAWEQDLDDTYERNGGKREEKPMERLKRLGYM